MKHKSNDNSKAISAVALKLHTLVQCLKETLYKEYITLKLILTKLPTLIRLRKIYFIDKSGCKPSVCAVRGALVGLIYSFSTLFYARPLVCAFQKIKFKPLLAPLVPLAPLGHGFQCDGSLSFQSLCVTNLKLYNCLKINRCRRLNSVGFIHYRGTVQ